MTDDEYKYMADARHKLQYGCKHEVWVQTDIVCASLREAIAPVVRLSNDDDPHYVQTFNTPAELQAFIQQLEDAGREAWGDGE